jgi:hypothetical protein
MAFYGANLERWPERGSVELVDARILTFLAR